MDVLLFLQIFITAVNAGKVNFTEPNEEITNDEPHEETEEIAKRNAQYHGSYPPLPLEPIIIYNAPEHGSYSPPDHVLRPQPGYGSNDCFSSIPVVVSHITVTTTKLWLETITYSSFLLSSSVDTVYVTNTVIRTSGRIEFEPPITITAPPPVENVWESITNTQTKIWEKFYTNMIPVTTTFTKYTQETECPVVCSTRTVRGHPIYETETTTWTHTQTMHEKVMVTTVWDVTVTITDHQGNVEADRLTDTYTITRTVVETEFDMITQITASTLWVTHLEKENCH